jgi:hypothetical protein
MTTGAVRATTHAAANSGRGGWLDSLKSEAMSFLKGDNNSPWAIFAETVIGCVPVLGQLVDARDIIKGLIEVAAAPASPMAWFNLITALIGLVPGGGDAAKRSLRAIKGGNVRVDELLDMIRRLYKGDPEKVLRDALDLAKLRAYLNQILDNPRMTGMLNAEARRSIDTIQANLNWQFDAFKREVDGWLARGRRTSAGGVPSARQAPGTPPAKPQSPSSAGNQNRTGHGDPVSTNTPNAASQRTARFKSLTQKVLGVLGEHMADFHCQDAKGWGANTKARHDQGAVNAAKLNDSGRMVQLWPCIPRGRGIDAVWRSNGAKPYAIIEAKASYDPTKSLQALLGEAGDKTEAASSAGASPGRGGGAGRRGGNASPAAPVVRQTNGKATQMGHAWIQKRLLSVSLTNPVDKARLLREKQLAYTRHVVFFSIPQAVSHAEALIKLTAQQQVPDEFHGAHQATREWTDSAIDKVVDNRAGLVGEGRNK